MIPGDSNMDSITFAAFIKDCLILFESICVKELFVYSAKKGFLTMIMISNMVKLQLEKKPVYKALISLESSHSFL